MKTSDRRAAAALAAMLVLGCAERSAGQAVPESAVAEALTRANAAGLISLDLGNGATMEFVLIRPGSFMMGDTRGSRDEQPVHKVTITRPFYLGKYLVTQKQWKAVMGSNPSTFEGPQNPVDSVSWDGCQALLAKLNARFRAAGAKFSLPTEAQWEYACRAGSTGIFYYGDAEDRLGDYAWFSDNAGGKTHPVGEKKPNPWGLYDMYGNVWQWCADWYDADYYQKSPASDPAGPPAGSERVMRGGSWYRGAVNCRSADRYRGVAGCPDYGGGLRVVLLSAPTQAAKQKPATVRLTGDWIARFHGLPGVFRPDRARTTLATIAKANADPKPCPYGMRVFANADGSKAKGDFSYWGTAVLVAIAWPVLVASDSPSADKVSVALTVEAVDYTARTIYHSPETPGWTSWVGLWLTPDGPLQCSFNQQTGPRDRPVAGVPVLESRDEGGTWTRVEGDIPRGGGRGMAVLKDGTLVRPRWASDPNDAGYVERSTDAGRTWGQRIDLLPAKDYRVWPTIIRPLRDGRLVLMAGVWKRGDGTIPNPRMTKMVFVSKDQGRSWGPPITLMPVEQGVCEESDFCELPSGDLFWVHRVEHFPATRTEITPGGARIGDPFPNGYSDRMQSIVARQAEGWRPGPATLAPFSHSGFPEVLLTREGVILHLATDGVYWTADLGRTWTKLPIPGTAYYPRAVQLASGKILCVGHAGGDDVYGTVDQSILQQTFRLKVREKEP